MKRKRIAIAAILAVCFASAQLAVAQEERGFSLRGEGIWVNPDVDYAETNGDGDRTSASSNDAWGFGLGAEYRVSKRFGIDLAYQNASSGIDIEVVSGAFPELRLSASDDVRFSPITLAFDLHLTPGKAVDLIISPVLAWVGYGDLDFRVEVGNGESESARLSVDDDLAVGGRIAAKVALGEGPWSIYGSALYLQTEMDLKDESGDRERLDFDPLVISVGAAYRF